MPRWEPDAAGRLTLAALELFDERGYERTSVIDIATGAGLAKSTFFRHFKDKREVLFGGEATDRLLVDAIAGAPAAAGPAEAVALALDAAGHHIFTQERHQIVSRRRAVIDAHSELREREALKNLSYVASMADALRRRGTPDLTSSVAAHLGALAVEVAEKAWVQSPGNDFGQLARQALADVHAAATPS